MALHVILDGKRLYEQNHNINRICEPGEYKQQQQQHLKYQHWEMRHRTPLH